MNKTITKFSLLILIILSVNSQVTAQSDLFIGHRGKGTTISADSLVVCDTLAGGGISIVESRFLTTTLPATSVEGLYGMSLNPFTSEMYVVYGVDANANNRRLGIIDVATAIITDIAVVGRISDIAFMDSTLYCTTGNNHPNQYAFGTLSKTTGAFDFLFTHINPSNSNAVTFDMYKNRFLKCTQVGATWHAIDAVTKVETNLPHSSHPGWTTGLVTINESMAYTVGDLTVNLLNTNDLTFSPVLGFPANDWLHSIAFKSYPTSLWVNGERTPCQESWPLEVVGSGTLFQWYKDSILIAGASLPTYSATESGDYYVVVDGVGTNHVKVVIDKSTIITAIAVSDSSLCAGDPLILEGTSPLGSAITWDNSVTDGVSFFPPVGTTVYTATAGGGTCEYEVVVTVNAYPTVNASVSDSTICMGDTVLFNGLGADAYVWDNGVTDSMSFVPSSVGTTTYTVIGSANGCSDTATVNVVVNTLPTVLSSASSNSICVGDSVTLNGSGADSYIWDMGITNNVAFQINTIGTVTYAVTGTDTNGCISTSTETIVVNAYPAVTASVSDSSICVGDTVVFSGVGASTYTWDNGISDNVSFVPSSVGTTTYTVIGSANGCSDTATINVVVNALPTVLSSASSNSICVGDSVTLNGAGADSYIWDMGVMNNAAFQINSIGAVMYTVTGTDTNGCINTSTETVAVNAYPVVIASVSDSSICIGNAIVFNGSGANSYTWDNGVTDNVSFQPSLIDTTTYTVIGTTNGCSDTTTINVIVNAYPVVIASVSDSSICIGDAIVFNGSGANSYTWDNGATDNVSFVPSSVGTTTYTVIGSINGCSDTASVDLSVFTNSIVISGAITDAIGIATGEIDLTVTGGTPSYTYDWDTDGTGDFDDTQDLTGLIPASYVVIVMDSLGCQLTDTFVVNQSSVGIEEFNENLISIYPNPTSNKIIVTLDGEFGYQLMNATGELLEVKGSAINSKEVSLTGFANGIYFLRIKVDNKIKTFKIIKK